jgi:predicted phosphodiesterase
VPTLLLSDIHGNIVALEAVLDHASKQGYDRVVFLGDAVGYYPDGNAVVERLRALEARGVMGNHDAWLLTLDVLDGEGYVFDILRWQAKRIRPENRAWLASLPWHVGGDGWLAVHGSPCDPFTYVDELEVAREAFGCTEARWVFHGHTHLAGAYTALDGPSGPWVRHKPFTEARNPLKLGPKARVLVNPGSVGQPRDGVPLAGYAIWNEEKDELVAYRVEYDIAAVEQRVRRAGFPAPLFQRLYQGR